jgi:hypothetical protein
MNWRAAEAYVGGLLADVAVLLLGLAVLAVSACGVVALAMCGSSTGPAVPSPDGQHVAYVSGQDCGATTAFSTEVLLYRVHPFPLSLLAQEQAVLASRSHPGMLALAWQGPDHLVVAEPPGACPRVYSRVPGWDGVRVSCRSDCRAPGD